jgi:mRNA-degrading endonuclease RelE of RelBE toxin-antitoxin system
MRISASEQVQVWLAALAPDMKRRVRAALRALESGGRDLDLKPLRGELEGFHRLRIGHYRIVYHHGKGQTIHLDYADLRDEIYEAFRRLRMLRESTDD